MDVYFWLTIGRSAMYHMENDLMMQLLLEETVIDKLKEQLKEVHDRHMRHDVVETTLSVETYHELNTIKDALAAIRAIDPNKYGDLFQYMNNKKNIRNMKRDLCINHAYGSIHKYYKKSRMWAILYAVLGSTVSIL